MTWTVQASHRSSVWLPKMEQESYTTDRFHQRSPYLQLVKDIGQVATTNFFPGHRLALMQYGEP